MRRNILSRALSIGTAIVGLLVFNCSGVQAKDVSKKPVLVPQIGYPGGHPVSGYGCSDFACHDVKWIAGTSDVVGISHDITRWDSRTWTEKLRLPLPGDASVGRGVVLSPDGKYAVVDVDYIESSLIDTRSGRTVLRLGSSSYSFSPDSHVLVEATNGSVGIYSVPQGKLIKSIALDFSSSNYAVAISPDRKMLVTIDDKASLWDIASGKKLRTLGHNADIHGPAVFSPDGRYLATAGEDPRWTPPDFAATEAGYYRCSEILLWDVRTGRLMFRHPTKNAIGPYVNTYFFLDHGRKLLSIAMGDGIIWSVPAGKQLRTIQSVSSPYAISPDENYLLANNERFSLTTGKRIDKRERTAARSYSIAFSPDGNLFAAFQEFKGVTIWDISKLKLIRSIKPNQHDPDGQTMFFATNDRLVVASHYEPAQEWNPYTGDGETYVAPQELPDDEPCWQCPIGEPMPEEPRSPVTYCSIYNNKTNAQVQLQGSLDEPLGEPSFSPDGQLVAIPARANIIVFRTSDGHRIATVPGGGVKGYVVFHPSGKLLAVSGGTSTKFWDTKTWTPRMNLIAAASGLGEESTNWWLAYTPDGYYTGSAGVESHIKWRVGSKYLPGAQLSSRFRRADKVLEALGGIQ